MEAPGYYGILPANVRYDKNLKPMEKIMYSELTALSNKNGYCNATNSYFAELYEVSKNTVSLWISDLEKAGYIKTKLIYEVGTKIIKERRIYIADPITKNNDTYHEKEVDPITKNNDTPITKNREDNNTSINNTRLIITNNNNLENIIEDQDQKEKVVINSNGALQQEIKMLLGIRKIKVYDIIKLNKPIERIKFVIDFCNKNNKADGYLFKALKDDWELKEVQQVEKTCYLTKPKEAYKELV
ncbi:helix-turn-helix domain-containing protein [Fusobacterium pseudoperiodonticum]|uniref:helix-turn-helix domain-containing protein n=1 Tax=Fusobacterium pseudoperiodonticum TaxID=2663009 RepID=UPI000C1BA2F3|nr:helix-turn-helix domain-containing protein [Fusobacterium pseudoperiodonticum]ATV64528.1 helix-turn-helix domain-containing protein [Fusobacterium pseudoperiodonticum]